MKKILFLLMMLPIMASASGIVNNSTSSQDAADSISIPFFALDSAGNMHDMATGDSVYVHFFYPSGALAFRDSLAFDGSKITAQINHGFTTYTWKEQVSNIDGTPEDGVYSYVLVVEDNTTSALFTPHKGHFQLYTGDDFDVWADSLTAFASDGAIDAGKFAAGAIDAAALNTDAVDEIWEYDTSNVDVAASVGRAVAYGARAGTPANAIDVTAGGNVGVDWNNVETPGATVALSATTVNLVTTTTTATTATTVTNLAAAAVDDIWDADTNTADVTTGYGQVLKRASDTSVATQIDAVNLDGFNPGTDNVLPAADVDLIWDELLTGHSTVATFGQVLNGLGARTGEVADAGPVVGDFDVDGFTEGTNDHFNGMVMVFTSGALTGQARIITDYTGSGQNMVFADNWTNAPANNDDFIIVPTAMAEVRFLDEDVAAIDLDATTIGTVTTATNVTNLDATAVDDIWDTDTSTADNAGSYGQVLKRSSDTSVAPK